MHRTQWGRHRLSSSPLLTDSHPRAVLNGAAVSVPAFLCGNLLPVTLGNVVGGGALLAFGYWYAYGTNSAAAGH